MQIELSVSKIKQVFETAEKFMGNSSVDTYYNYALINVLENGGQITTSNGDFSFTSPFVTDKVVMEAEKEKTNFLLPLKSFLALVKKLPQDTFSLKVDGKSIKITGKKFKYSLPINIENDFVDLIGNKEQSSAQLVGKDFASALDKVVYCSSTEELATHIVMKSVYIKMDKDVTDIVATNRDKLAYKVVNTKNFIKSDKELDVIIPLSTVKNIIPLLSDYDGDVEIKIYDNILQFVFSNKYIISARKIDGPYPNYKTVISLDMNEHEIVVNTKELSGALSRVMSIAEQRIVCLKIENAQMIMIGKRADRGEGEETLDIINDKKFNRVININAVYFSESLSHMTTDEVVIRINENSARPIALKEFHGDDNYITAVSPIRMS